MTAQSAAAPLGIWLVRPEGDALAAALQARLGGDIYRPWLQPEVAQKTQFAASYRRHAQWIMVAASGIAVRFLEGLPVDKHTCLLYTSPSPRDRQKSRMPSSA